MFFSIPRKCYAFCTGIVQIWADSSKTLLKIVFLETSCIFKWGLLTPSKELVCPLNLLLVHHGYSIVCWRHMSQLMEKVSWHLLTLKSHLNLLIPLRVL